MRNPVRLFSLVLIPTLLLAGCNLPAGSPPPATGPATSSGPDAGASAATEAPASAPGPGTDAIRIMTVFPPVANGLSARDPLSISVAYTLNEPAGQIQVWFERFQDADCTVLGQEPGLKGGSTMPGGVMQNVTGGTMQFTISIPPIPPFDTPYIGVGVRLWDQNGANALAEDMSYDTCYAARAAVDVAGGPSVTITSTPGSSSTGTGSTARTGTIAGIVYLDNNNSGNQDASEPGIATYSLTLANGGCIHSIGSVTPNANGQYSFAGLIPGTYCVVLNYSGGRVAPGTFQWVDVIADNSSPAFFGIQPVVSLPPPPAAGYCGDGVVDSGLGEQCDPPNVTNCTASCQNYSPACGNGIVDAGEQCDPPNVTNCTAFCQNYTAVCGNGIVDVGEQCDPPNPTTCTASCQIFLPPPAVAYCGDGVVDAGLGEQCDPPNVTDCTASCQNYTAVCGNGIVDAGEQCDPPNTTNCTAFCQNYTAVCGNGIVDVGEQCDPPNTTNCTASCQNWP
jgi:hypothetical protein